MSTIYGTRGDDTLAALNDGDVIYGLWGHDLLTTSANNTTLHGGEGDDVLVATNDVHVAASDADLTFQQYLDGGNCYDDITVNTTADVAGDTAADTRAEFVARILGYNIGDEIDVNMVVTASSNADVGAFTFAADVERADIDLSVTNVGSALAGASVTGSRGDRINISLFTAGDSGSMNEAFVNAGGCNDIVTVSLTGPHSKARIFVGDGCDSVTVNTFGDAGSTVSIAVWGGNGSDTITTHLGADQFGGAYLDGGNGSDKLSVSGGTGSILAGGAGQDYLTGSSAGDVFQFGSETSDGTVNKDWIINYSKEQGDVIHLNGDVWVASWAVVNGSTQLHLNRDGDVIILKGVVVHDLYHDVLIA